MFRKNNPLDVLFINPRISKQIESPSYGCLWMIAYLREHGYTAQYFDGNLQNSYTNYSVTLTRKLRETHPKIVGITATSFSYPAAREIIPVIKKHLPNESLIVLGGVHATHLPEQTWNENPEVDVIVRGPGFHAMTLLLETLGDFKNDRPMLFGSGSPIAYAKLPRPAWDLIDFMQYSGNYPVLQSPSTTTFSSFGCPHQCVFCSLHMKRPYYRDPNVLVEELAYLVSQGIKEIFLYDDEFNLNPKHVFRVCEAIIEAGLHEQLSFKGQMRTSERLTDLSMLKAMREANFTILYWGIESGSQHILDSISKQLTVEESERALRIAKGLGFKNYGFFMVQNRGESWIDVQLTAQYIRWNREYLDYAQFTIATPYPGSRLYDQALTKKWFLPEMLNAEGGVDFSQFNTHRAVMNTPWMSAEEAEKAKFYLEQAFLGEKKARLLKTGQKLPLWLKRMIPKQVKARVSK